MIERLQRALGHVDELSPEMQEEVAEFIEQLRPEPESPPTRRGSLAGVWSDLPDDMEETLLRWRRESPPTPPIDEQLGGPDEE